MSTVTVHALSTGSLTANDYAFIFPADPTSRRSVPSMSFLIQHQNGDKPTRMVFDLGLRRDVSLYPAPLQKHCQGRQPLTTKPDVVESLAKGGLTPNDIDYIVLSHVHYDHIGLPSDFSNPKTTFIVGSGALDLLSGKTVFNIGSHSFFEKDLLPLHRTIELPPPPNSTASQSTDPQPPPSKTHDLNQTWTELPQFKHAVDLFSDGTVYILDLPGHLPGHIGLLCRVSPEKYVALVGDACHDVRLLTGERDISTWVDDEGNHCCIHADPGTSKKTLKILRTVQTDGLVVDGKKVDVEIVFAHDWQWERYATIQDRFWPGKV